VSITLHGSRTQLDTLRHRRSPEHIRLDLKSGRGVDDRGTDPTPHPVDDQHPGRPRGQAGDPPSQIKVRWDDVVSQPEIGAKWRAPAIRRRAQMKGTIVIEYDQGDGEGPALGRRRDAVRPERASASRR
jgi:hypothetical protein